MLRMWLSVLAVLLCGLEATAQITSLATDRTGSKVVFSSEASLRRLEYGDNERIYEARPGAEPVLVSELQYRSPERGLMWPAMSGDGLVLVWTDEDQCTCCSGCFTRQRYFAKLRVGGGDVKSLGSGAATSSANGRWVSWGGGTGLLREGVTWLDLQTGDTVRQPWNILPAVSPGARGVSDDGARVFLNPGASTQTLGIVWPDGRTRTLQSEVAVGRIAMDFAARVVVFEQVGSPERLWIAEFEWGEVRPLVEAAEGIEQPHVSEDGSLVGFISAANWSGKNNSRQKQFWMMELANGKLHQVTTETRGVRLAAISGNGNTVYVVNGDGDLVRVQKNGERATIFYGIPWPTLPPSRAALVPGTRSRLEGSSLEDAEVMVDGVPARVVRREINRLDFITPDVGNSQSSTLTTPSSRDLFQPRRVWSYVRALAPSFWTWSDRWPEIGYLLGRYAWALHGNSDRLITPEDPLLPGEWFKVQVAGVRLEDAARLRWVWVKSGDERVEIESGGIMLDPELEGLLRVKLKAPVFEPGTGLWIGGLWPEEGVSSSFSPLPTGEPATQP